MDQFKIQIKQTLRSAIDEPLRNVQCVPMQRSSSIASLENGHESKPKHTFENYQIKLNGQPNILDTLSIDFI